MSDPSATASDRGRWVSGPWADLLFGCGLLYFLFFALQCVAGPGLRKAIPPEALPFLILLLGSPHYGATLLKAVGDPEGRRRYGFLTLVVSLGMLGAFIAGATWLSFGSWLLTVYLTWSPWHYSGQNYGVALLFLHARGADLDPATKRLFRATFLLSYAFLALSLQVHPPEALPGQGGGYAYALITYQSLGLPRGWVEPLAAVLLAGYATTTGLSLVRLRRAASWSQAGPALGVMALQAVWFLVPAAALLWPRLCLVEPLEPGYRTYAAMWVASGHFIQYLWITTRRAQAERGIPAGRYFLTCLLAGSVLWTFPPLLLAPRTSGALPFDMGLGLLVASVVNLHHFILDGVIWKGRPGPLAAPFLNRGFAFPARSPRGLGGLRAAGLVLGLGALVASLASKGAVWAGNRALRNEDFDGTARAMRVLGALGQDSPKVRLAMAKYQFAHGAFRGGLMDLQRSLRLWPTPEGWDLLGWWLQRSGHPREAEQAYAQALALDPADPVAQASLHHLRQGSGRSAP